MNRDDQFEKRLRRQPLREIPPAWREEVLAAAERAAASRHSSPVTPHTSWWRELFWPCPRAWAGLAAAWLVILGASFAARDQSPAVEARRVPPPSPQLRQLLKQQEQLLAELVGPPESPEAHRSKPAAPQPRSQRREEFLNA
jgi:hypothetical protein